MWIDVTVTRVAYQTMTISVDAASLKEAEMIALNEAPDHEFPNAHTSEYEVIGSNLQK